MLASTGTQGTRPETADLMKPGTMSMFSPKGKRTSQGGFGISPSGS